MARMTVVESAALAGTAAERLTQLIGGAVADHGSAIVSLTGGSTPERTYETLARDPWRTRIDWHRVHLFWGDERHVPPDHPDSNFGMARRALLDHVPVPATQVHRMRGELPEAREAAAEYEKELRTGFAVARPPGPASAAGTAATADLAFDVMLLGLGEDAHIASIFPGSPLLEKTERVNRDDQDEHGDIVQAVFAPHLRAWRITLTPPVILTSRAIVMLVSGEKKADAVAAALEAPLDVRRFPAQMLREAGDRVEWLLDRSAAAGLTR